MVTQWAAELHKSSRSQERFRTCVNAGGSQNNPAVGYLAMSNKVEVLEANDCSSAELAATGFETGTVGRPVVDPVETGRKSKVRKW